MLHSGRLGWALGRTYAKSSWYATANAATNGHLSPDLPWDTLNGLL
jgi:hypothetical protein